MPNENISCASSGNSSQSSSTRKDKKPLKLRASLCLTGGDDGARIPQFAQVLEKNRMSNRGFDAALSVQISGCESVGFEDTISQGMKALYRDILSVNAPDKLFEMIVIDASELRPDTPGTASAAFFESAATMLRQELQAAGFTVQKVELRQVESLEKPAPAVFA